nr:MAG TPA: hypothetical protein [Caudoviricetes sp.]
MKFYLLYKISTIFKFYLFYCNNLPNYFANLKLAKVLLF